MMEMERHLRHSPPQPEIPLSPPPTSKHHCTSKLNGVMNPLPLILSSFGTDNFSCPSSSSESSLGGFLQKAKGVNRSDYLHCNLSSVGDSSSAASSIDFLYISPTKEAKEEEEEKSLTPDQGIGVSLTNSATSVPDFSNPSTAGSQTSRTPVQSNSSTIKADIDEFVLSMLSTAQELSTFSVNDCYSPASSSIMSKSLKREKPSPAYSSTSSSEINSTLPRSEKSATEKSSATSTTETSNHPEHHHLVDEISKVESLLKELDEASPPPANRPQPTPKFQQMDDTYTTNSYVTMVRSITDSQMKQNSKHDALVRTASWAENLPAPPSVFSVTSVPTTPVMSRYLITKVSPDIRTSAKATEGDGYFTQYQIGSSHSTPQKRFDGFLRNFNNARHMPVSITLNHPTSQNSEASLTRSEKFGGKTKSESQALMLRNAAFEVNAAFNNDASSVLNRSIEIDYEREYLLEVQTADTLQAVHDYAYYNLSSSLDLTVEMRMRKLGRGIKHFFGRHEPTEQVNKDKLIGMPLYMVQALNTNGCPFPQFVMDIMDYVKTHGIKDDGIFRRTGAQKRYLEMSEVCGKLRCHEPLPEDYKTSEQIHDLTSLLKFYLRKLPQKLIPTDISEIVINVLINASEKKYVDILQLMIYILPDEHREALLIFLNFLTEIEKHKEVNNMTASNLAICVVPAIFTFEEENRRKTADGIAEKMKELNVVANAISSLIKTPSPLALIPSQILNANAKTPNKKKPKDLKNAMPPLSEIGAAESLRNFVQLCFKECKEQWPKWQESVIQDGIHFSTREVDDTSALKSYKLQLNVDASPKDVLSCLLNQRETWDLMTASTSSANVNQDRKEYIATINFNHYTSDSTKAATVLRIWDDGKDDKEGRAFVAEKSCKRNPLAINVYVYHSVFIIIPHQGKSILNYVSRVDFKGKSLSWYQKPYQQLLISQMSRFANLFRTMSD